MELVVAVDQAWGIGYKGNLLAHVREDMKSFRKETTGKTVILGKKTLETFPGGKPLPKRQNLILSHDLSYHVDDAQVLHSVDEVLAYVKQSGEEAAVIGGASVYKQFLPYCDRALITRFDATFEADAFFENLDLLPEWQMEDAGEWQNASDETDEPKGIRFRFENWVKK